MLTQLMSIHQHPKSSFPWFPGSRQEWHAAGRALGEFVLLGALTFLPSLLVAIDSVWLQRRIGEVSCTESVQHVCVLAAALLFAWRAYRDPAVRGAAALFAGFFGTMTIREFDGLLDRIVHGFWLWPALLMTAITLIYVGARERHTLIPGLAAFVRTHAYYPIFFGLLIILVFSQTFGSGAFLWYHLIDEATVREFKPAFQEGLEVYGYIILLYGAWRYARQPRVGHA